MADDRKGAEAAYQRMQTETKANMRVAIRDLSAAAELHPLGRTLKRALAAKVAKEPLTIEELFDTVLEEFEKEK